MHHADQPPTLRNEKERLEYHIDWSVEAQLDCHRDSARAYRAQIWHVLLNKHGRICET